MQTGDEHEKPPHISPIVQLQDVTKNYGPVAALKGITFSIHPGRVTCILGDNGAGKSTLIKVLSGRHPHTSGQLAIDGVDTRFHSPRDALRAGIATVYQDLAVVGLMPVWRNFFLGQELVGCFGRLRSDQMKRITMEELGKMGVVIPDVDVPMSTLSGGQRQVVAIARAVYFGARVLILDEPTAALGVKQSGVVLRYITAAAQRGIGVVFITHNPHHAYLVGDYFVLLQCGEQVMDMSRSELSLQQLVVAMAGGDDFATLSHELDRNQ